MDAKKNDGRMYVRSRIASFSKGRPVSHQVTCAVVTALQQSTSLLELASCLDRAANFSGKALRRVVGCTTLALHRSAGPWTTRRGSPSVMCTGCSIP